MPRYKMVVFSKAKEGRDKEYNDWYNSTHIHEILSAKGMKSAQRFTLALNLTQSACNQPYLAIYDIETNDLNAVIQAMGQGMKTHSDALDQPAATLAFYEESGAPVHHKG